MPERLLQVWASFRSLQSFLVTIEFLILCHDKGSLCHDTIPCRGSALFPCRNREGHNKRSGVAPFVLQQVWPWQGFLCRDRAF